MSRSPLFTPWTMHEVKPLYELLQALDAGKAYAAMRAVHAAERPLLDEMHATCSQHVRSRLELAPTLAAGYDLDALADQFADYVLELSFETSYVTLNLGDPERLFGELVDIGNVEVLDAARAVGPVLLTPLHVGPCYGSLGVLAHHVPLTTLYHGFPLEELRDTWAPGLDLQGIKVPGENMMGRCLDVLASGRVLSMFPELDPNGIGPLHVPVPFLGTHVAAPTGPALVAQRAGAQLVPYTFSATGPGRYAFRFEEPIDPGTGGEGRRRATARIFEFVERTLVAGEPGKWEMWWEFERMADAAWLESQQRAAA